MARLKSAWHSWYVIEGMEPNGTHTDEIGQWADFTMTVRRRWWFFLHPGYWLRPNRWRSR